MHPNGNKAVEAYYSFMVDAAKLFGANVTKATVELQNILRFEVKLAKVCGIEAIARSISLIFVFSLSDFHENCPA